MNACSQRTKTRHGQSSEKLVPWRNPSARLGYARFQLLPFPSADRLTSTMTWRPGQNDGDVWQQPSHPQVVSWTYTVLWNCVQNTKWQRSCKTSWHICPKSVTSKKSANIYVILRMWCCLFLQWSPKKQKGCHHLFRVSPPLLPGPHTSSTAGLVLYLPVQLCTKSMVVDVVVRLDLIRIGISNQESALPSTKTGWI